MIFIYLYDMYMYICKMHCNFHTIYIYGMYIYSTGRVVIFILYIHIYTYFFK